ncbi:MAG: calcium-binding protein [Hyphomonadaceae bacterium]|nr:calcium-binding protein [Hyphomonadaceae bacterium]
MAIIDGGPESDQLDGDQSGPEADTINGFAGADTLRGLEGDDTLNGGEDADNLRGGAGSDTLNGDEGNDLLIGDAGLEVGDDIINGGDGDDFMRGARGVDTYDGGEGFDRISFYLPDATEGVIASLLTGVIENDGFGNSETMTGVEGLGSGTAFADILVGDDNDNLLIGGLGDTLTGNGGDDDFQLDGAAIVDGGDGNDTILGVFGFEGSLRPDTDGDGNAETVYATVGVRVFLGNNLLENDGFGNSSTLISIENFGGSALDDYIEGSSVNNLLWGFGGADEFYGLGGDDIIEGGDGADVLFGDGWNNWTGPSGDDTLDGGAGDDFLRGGDGADTYIGGDGFDRISFYMLTAAQGVNASILTGVISNDGFGNAETMTGIEGLGGGTAFADSFEGDDASNLFVAGIGDTITALGGNDGISLEGAADVDGGLGIDTILGFSGQEFGALVPDQNSDGFAEVIFAGAGVVLYLWDELLVDDGFGNSSSIVSIENAHGSSLADYLDGSSVANHLWGEDGDDEIYGLQDNDILEGGEGSDALFGDGWNNWNLDSGDDTLDGGAGDDFLRGGDGVDTYVGGDGFDRISFYMFAATQAVVANLLTGVISNDGYGNEELIPNDIEGLGGGTIFADQFTGNDSDNDIIGGFADTLLGLGGVDFFQMNGAAALVDGGAGADLLSLLGDAMLVDENEDGLAEEIFTLNGWTVNLTTGIMADGFGNSGNVANIENVEGGDYADNITGGSTSNVITGGDGNDVISGSGGADVLRGENGGDTLTGGAGADTLEGGAGDDVYIIDATDILTESSGIDEVRANFTYTLLAGFEDLTLTGSGAFNATGNALINTLIGNAANNVLNGRGGADVMEGGAGDDTYVVDNDGDETNEGVNAGTDTVQSSITRTLGANLENLTLTGALAINGTGNTANNEITGNNAANVLIGGGANDVLVGAGGADTLNGGAGNDIFIIDATDTLIDSSGIDEVQASFTYTLLAGFEDLRLTGSGAINATGNASINALLGNDANNTLDGRGGADVMEGGGGDDTYVVDNAGDETNESSNEGTDTVFSSITRTLDANVEHLVLSGSSAINGAGNTLANIITGNSAANTLNGGGGNDILTGGAGIDTLAGGSGSDTFVLNAAAVAGNRDIINDFNVTADTIQLENSVFAALGAATGVLAAAKFWVGAAAHDANDRIIYNATTGALIYDANGNAAGGSVQIATLTKNLALTNADFVVI